MEIVQYIVDYQNLDVNVINSNKETRIMYATTSGYLNVVKYLINNNATFNNLMDAKSNTFF
jgi:ankyrin repeat protein